MTPDLLMIEYVNRIINRGDTVVAVTRSMMDQASPLAIEQVRQLCKINKVELIIVAD